MKLLSQPNNYGMRICVIDGWTSSKRRAERGSRRAVSKVPKRDGVPHLFESWEEVASRIRAARDIRLLLDFDGTLVSYRPRPNLVKLTAATRRVLVKLVQQPRVHIAIVSGRRSGVLWQFFRVPGIDFLGLYGAEENGSLFVPRKTLRELPALAAHLMTVPVEFPGVYIEEKGISFAVHFRGVARRVREAVQAWLRTLERRIRSDFRIIRSHSAWEIVPRQVQGKGAAVRKLTRKSSSLLPIYIGDDLTDEPAFKALRSGITIRVGERVQTSARYHLRNPREVEEFLKRLEEELS